LYDESQAFEVCLGWNNNAVADDYRRFRNLIQISPASVHVAYSEYLSNPLVKETESTMMLKSWEEYEDIFQTVWGMTRCKVKVNELLQISDQRSWSSAVAGGPLEPLDRNIQRVRQNDLKRIQPRESAGNPADMTLQCKRAVTETFFSLQNSKLRSKKMDGRTILGDVTSASPAISISEVLGVNSEKIANSRMKLNTSRSENLLQAVLIHLANTSKLEIV
jgi:hypothetical protein